MPNRGLTFAISLSSIALIALSAVAQTPRLQVTDNGRYLEYSDGTPFFYLGDTAWELFHRLDEAEAALYLENRADKGFTVIQAVVIAQLGGLTDPNPNGDLPLIDRDLSKPNEAYFKHVDFIVNKAEELGLFIGMLPTWGGYFKERDGRLMTSGNAEAYGRYLGERYKDKPVIWILGGDENIETDEERATVVALARGLEAGHGGAQLMTYHPRGPGLSSRYFHNEDWLDFNMSQSSHGARDHDNGVFVERDYALEPAKPTLDGEPRYESIMVGFYFDGNDPKVRFDDFDSRQAAYWAVFAGACGHTYGNNNIWQMWEPGRGAAIGADIPWFEAIDHPGAFQMGHLRKLMESRPFTKLRPAPEFIVNGPREGGAKARALLADDGSYAMVYSPYGEAVTVDRTMVKAKRVKDIWFNPRYGTFHHIHTGDNAGFQTFTPPSSGRGLDWVLVLDDPSKGY